MYHIQAWNIIFKNLNYCIQTRKSVHEKLSQSLCYWIIVIVHGHRWWIIRRYVGFDEFLLYYNL